MSKGSTNYETAVHNTSVFKNVRIPYSLDASGKSITKFLNMNEGLKYVDLKPNHKTYPTIISPTGYCILETHHSISKTCEEFLTRIAMPISRPHLIAEFQITVFSLNSASTLGLSVEQILEELEGYSKYPLEASFKRDMHFITERLGKLRLVLRNGIYYCQSDSLNEIQSLGNHPIIKDARLDKDSGVLAKFTTAVDGSITVENVQAHSLVRQENCKGISYGFAVKTAYLDQLKSFCMQTIKQPLTFAYDYNNDTTVPSLAISLRSRCKVRYYQQNSVDRVFSTGNAISGIIVLPCGAGKSLTGIAMLCKMGKAAVILSISSVSVDQWKNQCALFTDIDPKLVVTLTPNFQGDLPPGGCILITTYSMITYGGKRSGSSQKLIEQVTQRSWGCLVLDEVQYVPAPSFRKVSEIARCHCKIGLTATLLREDDLIGDLQWLIGPKLYEANWLELQAAGYLAKVSCSEVWCPMTPSFYKEYSSADFVLQRKLWSCNPHKLRVCEFLVRYHEAKGHKIIVFCDSLYSLFQLSWVLKRPFISGQVEHWERMKIIQNFKSDPNISTILLSKVGDTAIDIPVANIVIQMNFNFASRRQEAQRVGRILRPKTARGVTIESHFYSLLTMDSAELHYASARQEFVINQGYSYNSITMDDLPLNDFKLLFDDEKLQNNILAQLVSSGNLTDNNEKNIMRFDKFISKMDKMVKSSVDLQSITR